MDAPLRKHEWKTDASMLLVLGSCLTAKLTANFANVGRHPRTSTDCCRPVLIYGGRLRTVADVRNAVFKTVGSGGPVPRVSYICGLVAGRGQGSRRANDPRGEAGVVLHVVIGLKIDPDLDERVGWASRIELKTMKSDTVGRKVV